MNNKILQRKRMMNLSLVGLVGIIIVIVAMIWGYIRQYQKQLIYNHILANYHIETEWKSYGLSSYIEQHCGWKIPFLSRMIAIDLEDVQPTEDVWKIISHIDTLEEVIAIHVQDGRSLIKAISANRSLKRICLRSYDISDQDIANLKSTPFLENVDLSYTNTGNETLKLLVRTKKLHTLNMTGTGISPLGLKYIAEYPQLQSLNLSKTKLDDTISLWIEKFIALRRIILLSTGVGDNTAEAISKLPKIQEVVLSHTHITDNAMRFLSHCSLNELRVDSTNISDVGIQYLSGMQSLEYLGIQDTRVTDQAIVYLSKLHNLKRLDIAGSGISMSGWEQLMAVFPHWEEKTEIWSTLEKKSK